MLLACSVYSCSFMETARNTQYSLLVYYTQSPNATRSSIVRETMPPRVPFSCTQPLSCVHPVLQHKVCLVLTNPVGPSRAHSTLVLDALLEQGQFLVHLAPDLPDLVVRIHDMIFDRHRLLFLSEPLEDLPHARQLKAAKGYALSGAIRSN